ncbi:MAG: ATP-dependent DNA helicase [Lachnospiraceae bacterium]|nr:ATP-dependent DNA helicase [Lachnospiraceae bacterium]
MDIAENRYQIHISVRGLVEFLLRGGDIDNRHGGGGELTAMQEGSRIHKMIQGKMGPDYAAEVPLFFVCSKPEYELSIEGRADGVISNAEGITIDEIKGTYRRLDKMKEPVFVHLAQAKCYAYMYCRELRPETVKIRLTYCNIETEEIRYFYDELVFDELERWFLGLVDEYDKWCMLKCRQYKERRESSAELEFPFDYRPGQRELAVQVYQTINDKRKLFLEAPTGVGKTITTIFPAIKAIGVGKAERLFYLTAKTITRTVASEAFSLLRERGLKFRSVVITAKEKICFCEVKDCNPENCEYAAGHYDRINEALYALLTENEVLTRDIIEEYAHKYKVCPFELTLDATLFADGIVCDYNYLFDPHARLQRFFGEGAADGENIFLIDEAHNLLERGRDMYSAVLFKEQFMELRRSIKQTILAETSGRKKDQIEGQLSLDLNTGNELAGLGQLDDETLDTLYMSTGKKKHSGKSLFVRNGYAEQLVAQLERCNKVLLEMKRECERNMVLYEIDKFVKPLNRVYAIISNYLEEREQHTPDVMSDLLDFFFDVSHFLQTYEIMDENYTMYSQVDDDGGFMVKLFCMNPAQNLKECMKFGRSTILFSATFLPIQYYKKLLGGDPTDYEVYAKSVFDPKNSVVLLAADVTSKYTRRSEDEYRKIACYVDEVVHSKKGNYMIFCPSHAFMRNVFDIYREMFAKENEECIIQQETMSETDRENFLELFGMSDNITAFCVLGGIFSEGIDLKEDRLIGSVIIGTGLPQVCFERELLKAHFDEEDDSGFDYAYRYPGMNKVLQAAGRVIRTEQDRGVIALLDERFLQNNYNKLFPREWINASRVTINTVYDRLTDFWGGV